MRVISALLIFLWCYLKVNLIFYLLKEKSKKKRKEKLNLYMIKVQKSKLIKIIRYDDDDRRHMKLRSNTHGCELISEI